VFTPDPGLTHIATARENLVAVIESINQPQVSIPGKDPQLVQGYVCGVRNNNGSFSLYVGLFLPKSGENVVYAHERRQLSVDQYRAVEVEALQFLESMGFIVDNLNFRNMPPPQQEATMKRIPVFTKQSGKPAVQASPAAASSSPGPGQEKPPAAVSATSGARLARLLASF
jgi:hypothetical protein